MNVDYLNEVFAGETVRISSRLLDSDTKRLHYFHEMVRERDDVPCGDERDHRGQCRHGRAEERAVCARRRPASRRADGSALRSASSATGRTNAGTSPRLDGPPPYKRERDLGALRDRAPRVELGGDVGAADQRDRASRLRAAARASSRRGSCPAQTTIVSTSSTLRLAVDADVQSGVVDPLVLDAGNHRHAALLEQRAPDPAGGLREALADLARLALQQPDLARRADARRRPRRRRARGTAVSMPHSAQYSSVSSWPPWWVRNSPTSKPMPPAPMIATRSPATRRPIDDVDVARDLRMIDAGNRRRARHDAGREHDVVEAREIAARRRGGRARSATPVRSMRAAEVAQRLRELLLARNAAREVELAADLGGGVEQRDRVARLGGRRRAGEARRAGADDGDRASCAPPASARSSVSWQARGLTRHDAIWRAKIWSRHAWLQAMQVLISSARPAAALSTNSASARNGRAIDTMSPSPRASTSSATAGIVDPVGRDQRNRAPRPSAAA